MKVALDTNVLMSAIGTRGLCADLFRVILHDHDLVVGEQVLDELRRNLARKMRMPGVLVAEFEGFIRRQAVAIAHADPLPIEGLSRADARVLAEAIVAGADLLVTGDRELLELQARAPLRIVSPRQFWEHLRRRRVSP